MSHRRLLSCENDETDRLTVRRTDPARCSGDPLNRSRPATSVTVDDLGRVHQRRSGLLTRKGFARDTFYVKDEERRTPKLPTSPLRAFSILVQSFVSSADLGPTVACPRGFRARTKWVPEPSPGARTTSCPTPHVPLDTKGSPTVYRRSPGRVCTVRLTVGAFTTSTSSSGNRCHLP